MTALGNFSDLGGRRLGIRFGNLYRGFGSGPRPGFVTAVQVSFSSMWNLDSSGSTYRSVVLPAFKNQSGRIAQKKLPATRKYGTWKPFILVLADIVVTRALTQSTYRFHQVEQQASPQISLTLLQVEAPPTFRRSVKNCEIAGQLISNFTCAGCHALPRRKLPLHLYPAGT